VLIESGHQRLQFGEQSPPFGHREGADDTDRRDMERGAGAGQRVDEGGAALTERSPGVVVVAEGQQVERDEVCGCLPGEHPHPRRSRVQRQLQRLEVQAGGEDDHRRSRNAAAILR
jgi:hypothetical protein